MDNETWEQIERVHGIIPMEQLGLCNFLTLVCTGHTTGWAASFDFNLEPEWYEASEIDAYPFAARGETAAIAVHRAVDKVFAALKKDTR